MTINNISLYKFQRIDAINNKEMSELDKTLFTTCELFNMTETELDNLADTNRGKRKAAKLISKTTKIFSTQFKPVHVKRFGLYRVEYDVSKMTFGQYVELSFFLQSKGPSGMSDAHIKNGHYILASLCNYPVKRWSSSHPKKAEYFLQAPVGKVVGTVIEFVKCFNDFNKRFTGLFGLSEETDEEVKQDKFNTRYGWTYSASVVAEYERIPLDDVYKLGVVQVLNALMYLKEKQAYEDRQQKLWQKR